MYVSSSDHMSTYEFVCVCDANLRKEKSSVHSGQLFSGSDQKKKLFVLNIGKKKNFEDN
jgi:hypothetical protein